MTDVLIDNSNTVHVVIVNVAMIAVRLVGRMAKMV